MAAIPRYRRHAGPAVLSAGFRPFFLASAIWGAAAIPLWLAAYIEGLGPPTLLAPVIWHAHEMIFGFAAATVAGFLLTAIPNWTGRLPLQGAPLAILVLLWVLGRIAVFVSGSIGSVTVCVADLSFPAAFLAVVAREIVAGRNWRNLPMLVALALLLTGNLLVHIEALDLGATAGLGNRLGLATLLMLIALVGGRIIPSFTRNWLAKMRPEISGPHGEGRFDIAALVLAAAALIGWVIAPDNRPASGGLMLAAVMLLVRLARWRGGYTGREPLLAILHIGYGWLGFGLFLLGVSGFDQALPATAALHALTVGAIGTMTLAVMTRASLGHTGRPLTAGPTTKAIYALITMAAVLRLAAPFAGAGMVAALWLAGAAWSAAFGLFALRYGPALTAPRDHADAAARPI